MRCLRSLLGPAVDPPLRTLALATFVSTAGFAAFWPFVGVWAIRSLGATSAELGATLFVEATAAGVAGIVGGRLSDRVGRRPVLAGAWLAQGAVLLAIAVVGRNVPVGLALVVAAGIASAPGFAASSALVADLVPPAEQETAFASLRVVFNVAVFVGPPVAGVLLAAGSWRGLFVGIAIAAAAAATVAVRGLPVSSTRPRRGARDAGSLRVLASDRRFLVFWIATLLSWIVYVGYESALPVAATDSYGLSPALWGALVAVNPLLVTLLQLRVTRWAAPLAPAIKLPLAVGAMGAAFAVLAVDTSAAAIVVLAIVFVAGEMLWAPTSQAVAAELAPADARGAYMGAFGTTTAVAFALGPPAAFGLRSAAGDGAMWVFFGATAVAAAAASAVALRPTERLRWLHAGAGRTGR